MDKTHSLTTTWTCECGLENSIIKRSCTKCGKSIPDDTRQHIYEEEIRAHGAARVDRNRSVLRRLRTAAHRAEASGSGGIGGEEQTQGASA